jgi:hypothetical protein
MNAIFAVAFFAACVAAQTFDTTTTTDLNRLLLKNKLSTTSDLFRSSGLYGKQHYGGIQSYDRLATPWVLPQQSYYNQQYNRQGVVGDFNGVVYTLDEIVHHPLFRQYLTLPLFRQHLSHPLFQYYLTTPLFQQYWTIPQFQALFRNPYLFYKYIYPVVYSTESTVFDQVKTDSLYPYNSVDNVDTSIFGTQRRSFLDTLVNKQQQVVYPSIYGQSQNNHYGSIFPRHHLPYTYVMDKIFRNLFINKPQITEVVTDVKIQPTGQIDEQTFGKYVDPVTGQVKYTTGDINVVDEKIVPDFDDQIFGRKQSNYYNTKDALLKRLYLNKMLYGGDRKIDQLYPEFSTETVRDQQTVPIMDKINKLHRFDNILDKININGVVDKYNNYNKYNVDGNVDELIRTPVVDSDLLFNLRHKDLLRTVPLSKDLVKDFTLDSKYNDLKTMLLDNKPTITTKTVVV